MIQTLLRRIETNDETLKSLNIWSERELHQFITAVPENSNIEALNITGGVVMDLEVAIALSTILPRMPYLRRIIMTDCDCSNSDVLSILASALANKSSLKCLRLPRCNIGNEGAEVIVASLDGNTVLKTLGLDGNLIGDEGAIAVASLLEANSSIKLDTVELRNNLIGADGMSALATSLDGNRFTRFIFVDNNVERSDTHFKRALYNDTSIESVISSNHTLKLLSPASEDIFRLILLNRLGPEEASRFKILRFLKEQPTFVLTAGFEGNVMPYYMEKIGKDCQLNTLFELIRNMPGLFDSQQRRPYWRSLKMSKN